MSEAYRRAGVDLAAAGKAVDLIRDIAARASRPEVVESIGGFAGLFRFDDRRLLAAATDGVGTKLEVARTMGQLGTIGIDLVAMCANDVVTTGAEPLLFLDYISTGRLVPEEIAAVVDGIAEGCRRAGCALLGGETAEHPGVMEENRLDLAGFCVGVVDEDQLLGPDRVHEGDVLVGLTSSGLHSNGYSLVRKLAEDHGLRYDETPDGLDRPLGEALLEPTLIYAPAVLAAAREGLIRSVAHITGGGVAGNLPRALPEGLGAEIDTSTWAVPPIMELIANLGNLDREEMLSTFNMGLGAILIADPDRAEDLIALVKIRGFEALSVGGVVAGTGVRPT